MSLDKDEINRLRTAGFMVDQGTAVAQAAGSMSVYVSREHRDGDLYVQIILPDGSRLGCTATRGAVLGISRSMGWTISDDSDCW
jgi:hypothetical protein